MTKSYALVTLVGSGFDGNTGATLLTEDADNASGSNTLTINDWTGSSSVISISGLRAVSPGGGFAQPSNGVNVANADNAYINHNLNIAPRSEARGYEFSFATDRGCA